ncbi:MAG: RnfABCDGE type electron transport complex subunit G [Pseudomonadota bacterium]
MNADRGSVVSGTLKLGLFAAIAAAIVAGGWRLTGERIAANTHAARLAQFESVLGVTVFDTLDYDAPAIVEPPHRLPGDAPARIYEALDNGVRVARVFEVQAAGYGGPIVLLVGIDAAFVVTGVRVVNHTETPGLGTNIERERSDWITSFDGRSLDADDGSVWALKRDGGVFDAFTGATITPRAVVEAVHETLLYAQSMDAAP